MGTPRLAGTAVLVVAGSSAVQVGAVVAHGLFDTLGAAGVSGLRFALAAAVMLLVVRPRWRGRALAEWGWTGAYGAVLATMNLGMYGALVHLPLGVAVTIELLGPLALAATRLPHRGYAVLPAVCAVGLLLVTRPAAGADGLPVVGVLLAATAAVAVACYVLLAERAVARGRGGWEELTLALVVAALLTAPFSVPALPSVQPGHLPTLALATLVGVVLAYGLDTVAVRVGSARVVAVLLSFDPVLGAVLGAVLLSQALDGRTLTGIGLVVVAGALTTLVHGRAPLPVGAPAPPAVVPEMVRTGGA